MPILDRQQLEESPLADLHAIASELGIEGFRRLRREELIETLLAAEGGEGASGEGEAKAEAAVEEAVRQGCVVTSCVGDADLDVLGRIGALLRF